jgi:hypothetical protein
VLCDLCVLCGNNFHTSPGEARIMTGCYENEPRRDAKENEKREDRKLRRWEDGEKQKEKKSV